MGAPTPGPWFVKYGSVYVKTDGKMDVLVATAYKRTHGEQGANANLIAAAPDLLDALRAVQSVDDWLLVRERVEAAIAKAEGTN